MYCSGEENRYYKYDIFEMYGCVCMCLYISHIKIESCYSLLTCVWRLVTPVSALKVTCECGHVSIFYLVSLAFPWAGTLPAPLLTASYGLQLTDLPAAKSLREAMWGRKGQNFAWVLHPCGNEGAPEPGLEKLRAPRCPRPTDVSSHLGSPSRTW